jgi:acetyltransferase-like isoleucine patch superfamily enzyme
MTNKFFIQLTKIKWFIDNHRRIHKIHHLERAEAYRNIIINSHLKGKANVLSMPIVIEDFACISFNVSILKGVIIVKGAIIAAGSVFTN